MKCHLFLQGDIGIGKSTLIRRYILPHVNHVGGYFVRRIFMSKNTKRYVGFAINQLDAKQDLSLNLYVNNLEDVKGLFLYKDALGNWNQRPEVFAQIACNSLKKAISRRKKLILMDEIGGVELEDISFSNLVLNTLDEHLIHCLNSVNYEKVRKATGEKRGTAFGRVLNTYNKIKKHNKVELLIFHDRGDLSAGEKRLRAFVGGIFDGKQV